MSAGSVRLVLSGQPTMSPIMAARGRNAVAWHRRAPETSNGVNVIRIRHCRRRYESIAPLARHTSQIDACINAARGTWRLWSSEARIKLANREDSELAVSSYIY